MKLATLIILSTISLVSVALIISSYMAFTSFSSEFERTVTSDLKILTSNSMDKIGRIMDAQISDTEFLTSKSNLNLVGNHYSIEEKMNYLRDFESQRHVYTSISIYDLNGIKIGDTRNLKIGLDQSQKPFFVEAIKGEIFYDEVPVISETLGVPIVHFSGPMYDENGNINGVLTLSFSIKKIRDILDNDAIYSKPLEVNLISKDGMILYSSHSMKGSLSEEFIGSSSFNDFVESDQSSTAFFGNSFVTPEEEALFVMSKDDGFFRYRGNNWILVSEILTDVLFQEKDAAAINFMAFSGIILGITIFVSFIVARNISSPIKKLETEMEKVAKSDFDVQPIQSGSKEIESMSNSFQVMIKNIQKAEKEKEDFVARITHDLKQPLVPILGNVDLLELPEMGELNEMQRESVDEIHNRTNLLLSMIENLISAQKIGTAAMKFNIEELSVKTILNDCIKTHGPIMNDKNIEFFDSSTIDVKIKGDEKRIQETLTNLVQNAHDFAPEKGKIEIGVNDGEKEVTFFVKDNGEGIPKEKQNKLFKKYGQAKHHNWF